MAKIKILAIEDGQDILIALPTRADFLMAQPPFKKPPRIFTLTVGAFQIFVDGVRNP